MIRILLHTTPFSLSALAVLAVAHKILPSFKAFSSRTLVKPNTNNATASPSATASDLNSKQHPIIAFFSSISVPYFSDLTFPQKLALYQFFLNAIIYTTLTAAVLTVELVLCEIGDWLAPDARVLVWKLCTTVLIAMLVVAIPLLELFTFLYTSPLPIIHKLKYPLTAVLYGLWLFIFYNIGHFIPLPSQAQVLHEASRGSTSSKGATAMARSLAAYYYNYYEAGTRTFYEESLSRIVVIGICAMAILSGFAAVSTPYTQFYLPAPRKITDQDIDNLQRSINTTSQLISTKSQELQAQQQQEQQQSPPQQFPYASPSATQLIPKNISAASLRTLMTTIRAAATGTISERSSYEKCSLEVELESLAKVHRGLERDLRYMKATKEEQEYEKTPIGRLVKRSYFVFAVYCIYRLLSVLFLRNPIRRARVLFAIVTGESHDHDTSAAQSDALAITFAHIVAKMSPGSDTDAWTRQFSFILSGVLFVGSISSAITTFHSLTKAFPLLRLEPHLLFASIDQSDDSGYSYSSTARTSSEDAGSYTYTTGRSSSRSSSKGQGSHYHNYFYPNRHNLYGKSANPSSYTGPSAPPSPSPLSSSSSSSLLSSFFDYPSFALLIISQVLGVYIISSSLLLRSNLPHEMSSAITSALGAPLDTHFVEYLFETMFALVAIVSLVGVCIAERFSDGGRTPQSSSASSTSSNKEDLGFYDEEMLLETSDKSS